MLTHHTSLKIIKAWTSHLVLICPEQQPQKSHKDNSSLLPLGSICHNEILGHRVKFKGNPKKSGLEVIVKSQIFSKSMGVTWGI
jgi:hypothetical protein